MHDDNKETPEGAQAREARRDFLKKAGRFAIYTPPAMMVLMRPSSATIARSGGKHPHRKGPHDDKPGGDRPGDDRPGNRYGHMKHRRMKIRQIVLRILTRIFG